MNALLQPSEADDIKAIAAACLYAAKGDHHSALTRAVADARKSFPTVNCKGKVPLVMGSMPVPAVLLLRLDHAARPSIPMTHAEAN